MIRRSTDKGSPPTEGEPFIGYIRVSTWKEEKISPELQRASIEEWARRTGRHIVDWVEDLDATGRNFKRKIMRGIERVEGREAVGIAVWRYSRFGRDRTGNAINLARLEHVGGRLESATEQVDATTAIGRFQRGMILEFGAFESDRAGEQWTEAHEYRRGNGLPATGRHRFGYVWHPRRIPDPDRPGQWIMQQERYEPVLDLADLINDAYLGKIDTSNPETFRSIAAAWNAAGARTVRGSLFDGSAVRQYMDSGWAAGMLRLHDRTCKCRKYSTCRRYSYVRGAHPAIIQPETWDLYLAHRAETKQRPPRARIPSYALTSLIAHGHCRHNLTPNSAYLRGEHVPGYTYRCPHAAATSGHGCPGVYVTRTAVEKDVLDWLDLERHAEEIDALPSTEQQPAARTDPRLSAIRDRARIEEELAKVTSAFARLAADRAMDPDAMTPEVYEAARRRIAERESTLRAARDRAAGDASTPTRADVIPLVTGLLATWKAMDPPEQNGILRSLIRRVVVHRVERPGKRAGSRIEIHPVWEPDPWDNAAA